MLLAFPNILYNLFLHYSARLFSSLNIYQEYSIPSRMGIGSCNASMNNNSCFIYINYIIILFMSYSLDIKDYTLSNACFWGNCSLHFQKAREGNLDGRAVVNFVVAVAEAIPLFGQMISLFEMCMMGLLTTSSNDTIQDIKIIRRDKLFIMEENDDRENIPFPLPTPPEKIDHCVAKAICYGFNCERVRDYSWGGAWRAIQTSLSTYKIQVNFADLFHQFGTIQIGSIQTLTSLYKHKYNEELRDIQALAPYDNDGRANLLVAEMVMHSYGIASSLETVNGVPFNNDLPRQVFRNSSLKFIEFKERMEKHFNKENAAPILICGERGYTLNVVGIGSDGTHTTLWIVDPNINEGVNRSELEDKPSGLYTMTFDQFGKQISHSISASHYFGLYNKLSFMDLDFEKRRWAVLFPGSTFQKKGAKV